MKVPKVLAIIGLLVIILGMAVAIIPTTIEVWTPKSYSLVKEVATVYPQRDYWPIVFSPYILEESRNLVVNGSVKELKGYTFDFYVFNKINYELWMAGASCEAYIQAKNISSRIFSFAVTREGLDEVRRFVALNVYAKEPAQESWIDKVFTVYSWMDYNYAFRIYPYVNGEHLPVLVDGSAKELAGGKFNLFILDDENYDLWKVGQPYNAFYEAREISSCSFSFHLTPERVKGLIYSVVEGVEPHGDLNVKLSANISYMKPVDISVQYDITVTWEERSYSQVLGGLFLGGGLIALGGILMIAAAVVKYVFRLERKPKQIS